MKWKNLTGIGGGDCANLKGLHFLNAKKTNAFIAGLI